MKVLHLITRLDPGGSAENTLLACDHLRRRGWQVVLAAGPGLRPQASQVEGVEVPTVTIRHLRRDPSPIADLRALVEIWRLLRRERPAILHTHSAKAGILGRWAAWLSRVPHVVHTPHGHVLYGYARGLENWIYLLVERLTAPLTDRLVALSAGELRESAAAGIGRPERWVVVPSGVDLSHPGPPSSRRPHAPARATAAASAASPAAEAPGAGATSETSAAGATAGPGAGAVAGMAGEPSSGVRIGSVARLTHVKGLDLAIRAAAILRNDPRQPPFRLLLWGDGELRDELAALAAEQRVADVVHFAATDEPVTEFLARLDVYVQPSRNEGMGRALVMAQAAGLPVVATRVCGIPDVVLEGETGLLVEAEAPGALAGALARLLADEALRRRLGARARAWVREPDESGFARYSVEAMNWHLERLYRSLAGEGPPEHRQPPERAG